VPQHRNALRHGFGLDEHAGTPNLTPTRRVKTEAPAQKPFPIPKRLPAKCFRARKTRWRAKLCPVSACEDRADHSEAILLLPQKHPSTSFPKAFVGKAGLESCFEWHVTNPSAQTSLNPETPPNTCFRFQKACWHTKSCPEAACEDQSTRSGYIPDAETPPSTFFHAQKTRWSIKPCPDSACKDRADRSEAMFSSPQKHRNTFSQTKKHAWKQREQNPASHGHVKPNRRTPTVFLNPKRHPTCF